MTETMKIKRRKTKAKRLKKENEWKGKRDKKGKKKIIIIILFPFLFGPGSISQTQHWSRSRQLPQWHSSGLSASTLASERRYSCIIILKKLKRLSKPTGHHCLQNITGSGQKNALGLARLVAHITCLGLVKIVIISDFSQAPEPNKASWPMAFIKHDLSNFVPHKTATYILLLALASNV